MDAGALASAERCLVELGDLVGSLKVLADANEQAFHQSLVEPHRRAQHELQRRKIRNALLGEILFSDPAWEILLFLYSEQADRTYLATSELATKSGIPLTTVVRWLLTLESRGLIWRKVDVRDRRATNVGLTDKGTALMCRYFAA